MSNPDYPAFRRVLDAMVADEPRSPAVVERAEGPNVYIMTEELYAELTEKAEAYDAEHGSDQGDAAEEAALREMMEGKGS